MGATHPQELQFKAEDVYFLRMSTIHDRVCKKIFHQIFRKGTFQRPHEMSLFDYYDSKGINIKKFKKSLSKEQIYKINEDPDGDTFDITLLFSCIQWGCDKVADKENDKWQEGNKSLESLLTAVKNKRNSLAHEKRQFNSQEFLDQTEELRQLLTELLRLAGTKYNIPISEVDHSIKEVDIQINFFRDQSVTPLNFADCEKQNLFVEKGNMVCHEGKKYLKELYDGWDSIIPVSLILNLEFKVKLIYSEMLLLKELDREVKTTQKFEDLLANINYNKKDPVILLQGIAGVGKTTLTKKIISDWISGQSTITPLISYDLLLYAECRNRSVESFNGLIMSLMPELARSFPDDDFSRVVLAQKIILIIDGFDELNQSSSSLFNEVLELKRTYGLTIIVTTRPEKVQEYYHRVDNLQIKTVHIELIGIPDKDINTFVTRYVKEIENKESNTLDIKSLLEYLKETALQLRDLWKLPYILILLIILWAYNPLAVYTIRTAPELYWKIHKLICRKLMGRLLSNDATKHLGETLLEKRIDVFISSLGKEALVGLKSDEINLSEEVYQRLKDVCIKESIPVEEMTGAFLKTVVMRIPQGMEKRYSFYHKGSQEFQGALSMFNDILSKFQKIDSAKAEADVNTYLTLPENLKEKIVNLIKEESEKEPQNVSATTSDQTSSLHDTKVIINMFRNLHGSTKLDITKYQNLLTILNGMFYLGTHSIQDSIKIEALTLLKEAGIEKRQDWIKILISTNCNALVATFIAKQPDILKGEIIIKDFSLHAYSSLLKALPSSIEGTSKVKFQLRIQGNESGIGDLWALISSYQLKVPEILITDRNFTCYNSAWEHLSLGLKDQEINIALRIKEETSDIREFMKLIEKTKWNVLELEFHHDFKQMKANIMMENEIKRSFERYMVEKYMGALLQGMKIPDTINQLFLSIADDECYSPLRTFLQATPQLYFLSVSINYKVDCSLLIPLPGTTLEPPRLFLPDIQDGMAITSASKIAKCLLPTDGDKAFHVIAFPRLTVDVQEVLRAMKEVRVLYGVCFPSTQRPSTPVEEEEVNKFVKEIFNCPIFWKDEDEIWRNYDD